MGHQDYPKDTREKTMRRDLEQSMYRAEPLQVDGFSCEMRPTFCGSFPVRKAR